MSTIKDFENAPVGATATHADGSRAVKIDDGEQSWMLRTGAYVQDESLECWDYTLDRPAPATAREALDLAWELAHEVREGQVIPEGTRYLEFQGSGLREYTTASDFKVRRGCGPIRTVEPLPDPDWLDAPAVLARLDGWDHEEREVFIPAHEVEGSWVAMFSALSHHWANLRDVTPLYPKGGQDA